MDEDCFAIPDIAIAKNASDMAATDTCIFKSTHYDIANVVHIYLKDRHRYAENNIWEYLKTDATTKNQSWEIDVDNKELIFSIRTIVCNAFTERSLYWENAKDGCGSGDSCGYSRYLDTDIISVKLLNISSKLKDNKYICVLIKECKQFFI
jgi:hypothetical protein